jgi:hypothetical protein
VHAVTHSRVESLIATTRAILLAALCALAIAGCPSKSSSSGGGSAGAGAGGATFTEIYAMIFPAMTPARCTFCHSMPASEISNGKLFMGMDQAGAYAALVGKSSMSARCMGMPLVTPGQPEMSLFFKKVSSATPPCGSRMPLGAAALTDAQIEMIRSWIAAGAKNN